MKKYRYERKADEQMEDQLAAIDEAVLSREIYSLIKDTFHNLSSLASTSLSTIAKLGLNFTRKVSYSLLNIGNLFKNTLYYTGWSFVKITDYTTRPIRYLAKRLLNKFADVLVSLLIALLIAAMLSYFKKISLKDLFKNISKYFDNHPNSSDSHDDDNNNFSSDNSPRLPTFLQSSTSTYTQPPDDTVNILYNNLQTQRTNNDNYGNSSGSHTRQRQPVQFFNPTIDTDNYQANSTSSSSLTDEFLSEQRSKITEQPNITSSSSRADLKPAEKIPGKTDSTYDSSLTDEFSSKQDKITKGTERKRSAATMIRTLVSHLRPSKF